MLLTRTSTGWIVDAGQGPRALANEHAAGLTTREDLAAFLRGIAPDLGPASTGGTPLPPLDQQEVWAAGVTYFRSRTARMEESKASDGGRFYDLVYNAERPELFFKASPWRVVGSGAPVRIRRDARWNVPEPEFALLISPKGSILGYMCGNDMSSRDIEGENPLYLPQAKVYDGSCALGPSIFVTDAPLPSSTAIRLDIARAGATVFAGATSVAEMKRDFATLVRYLYQELSFPHGAVLLTGTGVIPPDDFTLQSGDRVRITIDAVGTLDNTVQ
jgi:2-dehydro-3-deoxy-D-arabinonate dehydratase